jgi:hypothetical protein
MIWHIGSDLAGRNQRIRDYVSVLLYHVDDLLCSRIYQIGPALNFDWPVSWATAS